MMNAARHETIVRAFSGKRLVVLGDLMMDGYLWGTASRISPEAPVMVVQLERETWVPGGAANVVNNLLALGARVDVVGVIGADAQGKALVEKLLDEGAGVDGIITDAGRPTTRKTRVVAHSQQVLRIDNERTHPVADAVMEQLLHVLEAAARGVDAIVVSDYNKGILTPEIARSALEFARQTGCILAANPKPPNVRLLAGAQLVSLNLSEAAAASNDNRFSQATGLNGAGESLRDSLDVETLVVTQGSEGLSLWNRHTGYHHIESHPVDVYDVAGAGDTVISVLSLALAAGASPIEAAQIANHAGACVVRKVGVATVSQDEILADYRALRG